MNIVFSKNVESEFVHKYLKEEKITLGILVDRIGLSYVSMSSFINYKRIPGPKAIKKLEDFFHVPIDVILPSEESFKEINMIVDQNDVCEYQSLVVWNNNPEVSCIRQNQYEIIMEIMKNNLKKRYVEILLRRFIEELTYEEIGKIYNLTRARIEQIINESWNKILKAYKKYEEKGIS